MIELMFEGGLGNQLFQYSFGRYLQKLWNEDVVYDISKYAFEKIEIRQFELKSFNIDSSWLEAPLISSRWKRFGCKYMIYLPLTYIYVKINSWRIKYGKEAKFHVFYQKCINALGFYRIHYGPYMLLGKSKVRNKIIRGQWFWKDMVLQQGEELKRELRIIDTISDKNQRILDQIECTQSIGIHIRRGDYIQCGLIMCDIQYYKRCMDKMVTLVQDAMFFIFSDDIEWVYQQFGSKENIVYVNNCNTAVEDMRLFYNCKHFILSNSTFSWWGAYLGSFCDKKVICPEIWERGGKRSSLILDEWIAECNV